MLKNKIVLLPLLAFTFLLSFSSFAADDKKACGCSHIEKMFKTLNLTTDQQAKIRAIKDSNQENMKANREQFRSIRSQLNQIATTNPIDESKLNTLITQKTSLMTSMMKNKVMIKNQIFNVLTPEQQKKYLQMMNQMETKKAHTCAKCSG